MKDSTNIRKPVGALCAGLLTLAGLLGGCQQTAPVARTQQQVWTARLFYSCSDGSTIRVTRAQGSTSALVQVDGRSYQLPRDYGVTGAEHYTTHTQTLFLQGNAATFEGVGIRKYDACTTSSAPVLLDAVKRPRDSQD